MPAAASDEARSHWVGAWSSAQQRLDGDDALDPPPGGVTLRQIVRLSIGGSRVRVRVANTFGSTPLEIAGVHIARSRGAGSAAIVAATDTALTFAGEADVSVPPGASYLSDAVDFSVEAFADIAISMRLPGLPAPQTGHSGSRTTSFLLGGDHLSDADLPDAGRVTRWHQLAGVDVLAPGAGAIVVLGDSITDGHGSTTDGNDRWTDFLARRLQAHHATRRLGVLNAGIGGNRLLHDGIGANALARFERDVLAQSGVSHLIVLEGVNDLGMLMRSDDVAAASRDALVDDIIGAYEQMIARAHAHGIRVFGGTILPYCGSAFYVCTPASEAARGAINTWIRTSGRFDAVIDFDAALRDPAAPGRLLPAYDSGDHLHPSPAGFRAMAQAVPPALFGDRAAAVWPAVHSPLAPNPELEARVSDLLERMTLEEKVGQIIQAEIKYITPDEVRAYHIGAVLNGGGTTPGNDRHAPVGAWVELADAYWHASMDTSDGGVAIPVLWGSDAVHGHNNVLGATLFPHNIGLGAAHDPELVRRIGAATAEEVRATGLDWTFAPTLAVVSDTRWGRTYESYSEDPALVAGYARAMVTGLQGRAGTGGFLTGRHVIATAKHFIGDGGTTHGIDRGDTRVSEATLARVHGAGFVAALKAGVQTIMASFSRWNGEHVHGHRYLLTDVLKGRLGFDGFVVGDWNGHRFVPGCRVDSCPRALAAGLDMFMVPKDWKALYENTLAEVERGDIDRARLDDAVRRILRVKMRAGLFEAGPPSTRALAEDVVGSDAHRRLAREGVRRSLVLLKNEDALLPLARDLDVLVAGPGADEVARQSGGWTLTWQGTDTAPADFPGATTIYEGIRRAVEAGGGRAVLREQGRWNETTFDGRPPDVAIVVFGETPYAEWYGDVPGIRYQRGTGPDLALLRKLSAGDVPVVAVFLTGRPLWVNRAINAADAFVVAWLPGSEGAGVADVLFRDTHGNIAYDFTGRLPHSWPGAVHQRVLDPRQPDYDPLFAYGYGLTYADHVSVPPLPERVDYGRAPADQAWLFVARAVPPWTFVTETVAERSAPTAAGAPDEQAVLVTPADHVYEGDALALAWRGGERARAVLEAAAPQDLSRYEDARAVLSLAVRMDEAPRGAVTLGMTCGGRCGARVSVEKALRRAVPGAWQTLDVDLGCFLRRGLDLSRVTRSLVIESADRLGLTIADVKIVPGAAPDAGIRCPAPREGPGAR